MSDGRRVLIVGNFLSHRTASRSVAEELASRLEGIGWKVATTSDKTTRLGRLVDMEKAIWSRRRDYDVAQVDVFSGSAFRWAQTACWSLQQLGKPIVLTLHGGLLSELGRSQPRRVQRLFASAAKVTVPSPYLLSTMEHFRNDLVLLPNPLSVDLYEFRPRQPVQPNLIWLRAFHEVYNPSLGPRVLKRVLADFKEARLTMIGPDKGDGSLDRARSVACQLGIDQRIDWYPEGIPKSEVPSFLNTADIFINTTNVDNAPVTVREAQACGLCVVSTNVGGIPYFLEHGEDGLLVERDDADAMASTIGNLIEDQELAERLAKAGRQKAENTDWSRVLPSWESLLLDVQDSRA